MLNQGHAPIWPQWLALTRILFSGQIAFNSEISRWASTEFDSEHGIRLRDRTFGSKYNVSLDDHLATLNDLSTFYGVILMRAYSLMEAHGKYIRYILDHQDYKLIRRSPSDTEMQAIQVVCLSGGVEGWGNYLLNQMGRDWQIIDGKPGLVQVSLVRNAIAHGYLRVAQNLHDDAESRGTTFPYSVGATISLSFQDCRIYLSRIKSFCRRLDGGVINLI